MCLTCFTFFFFPPNIVLVILSIQLQHFLFSFIKYLVPVRGAVGGEGYDDSKGPTIEGGPPEGETRFLPQNAIVISTEGDPPGTRFTEGNAERDLVGERRGPNGYAVQGAQKL